MRLLGVGIVVGFVALAGCSQTITRPAVAPAAAQASAPLAAARPLTAEDRQQLCDAVLLDVLTNKQFEGELSSYGTAGARQVHVVTDIAYTPKLPKGWATAQPLRDRSLERWTPKLLGVSIRNATATTRPALLELGGSDATISVVIFNAGGMQNGAIMGDTGTAYRAIRTPNGWSVHWFYISS